MRIAPGSGSGTGYSRISNGFPAPWNTASLAVSAMALSFGSGRAQCSRPHGSLSRARSNRRDRLRSAPMTQLYDEIGVGYGNARRPDPRIAAAIARALDQADTVVNVGAGAGSYESSARSVGAVEPSWERRYGDILLRSEMDLGYRLVTAKRGSTGAARAR